MNYTDFGVNGPDELEQDEWSLTRPTFETPKGGVATLVGWKGRQGSAKRYVIHCSLCASDSEVFGEGVFYVSKGRLTNSVFPCGCSSHARWSPEQLKTILSRQMKSCGYEFVGWVGDFKGVYTKVAYSCPAHGVQNKSSASNFLRGKRCLSCAREKSKILTIPEKEHVRQFMESGAFLPGTAFKRVGGSTWSYRCPKCSADEFVDAGVCSGDFIAERNNLKKGILSCRCSQRPKFTDDQWVFRIKSEISKRGSDLLFVAIDVKTRRMKSPILTYLCRLHGEAQVSASSFLKGHGCAVCGGHSQKQAYINTVVDREAIVAIKLGIAKDWASRLAQQNKSNVLSLDNLGVWDFPSVGLCKKAEKECKSKLRCGILGAKELPDGWTETVSVLDIEKVIAIYEKHGGVRIK